MAENEQSPNVGQHPLHDPMQGPAVPGSAYGHPPQFAPPPRPVNPKLAYWTSGTGVVLMLVIAAAVVLVIATVVNVVSGPASDNFDVSVTSCEATGTTLTTATIGLTVTNTSDSVRSATLKVEYRDGGARLDTDTALVRNVDPGDTVRVEESTILDAAPSGRLTCSIVGIS